MNHDEDAFPGIKVILLSAGGAALVALLVAAARREKTPDARQRVEDMTDEVEKRAKKAAKAAKKKQKKLEKEAAIVKQQVMDHARGTLDVAAAKAESSERDLKAAAWDAQQEAKAAESRLRAARQRVAEDAVQIASRVGSEARHLAGEGKDRLGLLRHREDVSRAAEQEVAHLRDELESLKAAAKMPAYSPRTIAERVTEYGNRTARTGAIQGIAADAAAAALSQAERSLRVKAPAMLAARSRAEAMEMLQKELGPVLREAGAYAATAALASWQASRKRNAELHEEPRRYADDSLSAAKNLVADGGDAGERVRADLGDAVAAAEVEMAAAREQAEVAAERVESLGETGKRRFWRGAPAAETGPDSMSAHVDERFDVAGDQETAAGGEAHRGKAGLFWGGAGLGLALYALLDAERREKALHFANEASVQIQELVRDMQGYDDEF